MSEEQPIFKVTDRRLFNADGSAREVAAAERPPATEEPMAEPPQSSATVTTAAAAATTAQTSGAGDAQPSAPETMPPPAPPPQTASETGAARRSADVPAANEGMVAEDEMFDDAAGADPYDDDPASFTNFLMSIASNAAASLGLMEHPATGLRAVDLPLAKHWIDTLGMLQQKTRGNLNAQEQQIIEGLLADMRMQFVALTSNAASPRGGNMGGGNNPTGGGRKFSGSDITGGR